MSWRAYIAGIVVLAALAVTAAVVWSGGTSPKPTDGADRATTQTGHAEPTPGIGRVPPPKLSRPASPGKPASPDDRREPLAAPPAGARQAANALPPGVASVDAGAAPVHHHYTGGVIAGTIDVDAGDPHHWDDPTNQRVLGDRRWMAKASDRETKRIAKVFEETEAAQFDPHLTHKDRQSSIDAARVVVDGCFDQLTRRVPGSAGRIIVAWKATQSGGSGHIRNPRITVNYKLEDQQFEDCVVSGLDGLTFAAQPGDPITVEYPFMYDGH